MDYKNIYTFSKNYASVKKKLIQLIIPLGVSLLFGGFLYSSIILLQYYYDEGILVIFIVSAISINYLINSSMEKQEMKRLKKQEKLYAQAFIKLHEEYKTALKDIKSRDEFMSIVSHELKTSLTVMLLKLHSELDTIRNAPLANFSVVRLMEVLKNSEKQIARLKSMINDLLDVSLITTGRMDLQREDVDLVVVANQITQSFSELLKRKKYKIRIIAKTPVVGKWDKVRIEQAITNLISNATKYGESKPIEITISKNSNQAKFIIKDHGLGIPSSEQKIIFDLFKRAAGNGEYKKGLGVGLFITSQIVRIHGGKIKVVSIPARGTSFIIELPLKK